MKRLGQLKFLCMGMFVVMVLKSVSSTPVTSRTEWMERRSFEGKPKGTRPIVNLTWARLRACRGGKPIRGLDGFFFFFTNCTTSSSVFVPSMKGKKKIYNI